MYSNECYSCSTGLICSLDHVICNHYQPVASTTTFDHLIELLTTAPVLAFADFSKPFILYTDASFDGISGILYQEQHGRQRPIAYASRSLSPSESRYPIHKLEFLALKWCIT